MEFFIISDSKHQSSQNVFNVFFNHFSGSSPHVNWNSTDLSDDLEKTETDVVEASRQPRCATSEVRSTAGMLCRLL